MTTAQAGAGMNQYMVSHSVAVRAYVDTHVVPM